MARANNFVDYTNKRFGKLLLIKYVLNSKWECVCDCGYKFIIQIQSITGQKQRRCKYCFYKEKKTHGCSKLPEYQAWKHMMERCYDKNDKMYANYGGRGITICKRWHNPKNFILDMGSRPSNKYSIDRINVNKSYSPSNCRWATKKEQMRNRTNNIYITYNGRTQILADWASECGLKAGCIKDRINSGWDIEKALATPSRNKNKQKCL